MERLDYARYEAPKLPFQAGLFYQNILDMLA